MGIIGLDIGHGKNTFPSNGKGVFRNGKGYAEFDFNQKVGKKLKTLLENSGHTVVLGQPFDSNDVSLTTRTNLYNKKNVDVVVSIHADANNSKLAKGRYYFYWHDHEPSKRLAFEIAKEVREKGYSMRSDNGIIASVPGTWTELHICRETKAAAILGENGFMTNDDDFELIFGSKQEQYTTDIAEAYFKGIQNYLGVNTVSSNVGTGIVKKYKENGNFYPNETIIVRDIPSTQGNIIARYYNGENLGYHTVHIGNGYVWLEYLRNNGHSGYIPIREYKNGEFGKIWGKVK